MQSDDCRVANKRHEQILSFSRLANFSGELGSVQSGDGSALNTYVTAQFDATLSWQDVQWLVR